MTNQEEKLIDYLYGEMNATERCAFEQELQQNPSLQTELAALQASRDFLVDLPEVKPPALIVEYQPKISIWRKWIIPVGIAASLLLLLQLFDFQVNKTPNGIAFSFGSLKEQKEAITKPIPEYITVAAVEQLIDNRAAAHRKELLLLDSIWQARQAAQAMIVQQKLNQQLTANQAQQKMELQAFAKNFKQEEIPELANLMQNLLNKHQQATQIMFGEAWANWQETRNNDLTIIKSEFANIYQNQTETDALLIDVINNSDDD